MKYFTAALFQELNTEDWEAVERASEEWDRRNVAYNERLQITCPSLPESLQDFLSIDLHDAELVRCLEPIRTSIGRPENYVYLHVAQRKRRGLIELGYRLVSPLEQTRHDLPVFRGEKSYWLYDEVDLLDTGAYSHRVLFSDGWELGLTFDQFQLTKSESLKRSPVTVSS